MRLKELGPRVNEEVLIISHCATVQILFLITDLELSNPHLVAYETLL